MYHDMENIYKNVSITLGAHETKTIKTATTNNN